MKNKDSARRGKSLARRLKWYFVTPPTLRLVLSCPESFDRRYRMRIFAGLWVLAAVSAYRDKCRDRRDLVLRIAPCLRRVRCVWTRRLRLREYGSFAR